MALFFMLYKRFLSLTTRSTLSTCQPKPIRLRLLQREWRVLSRSSGVMNADALFCWPVGRGSTGQETLPSYRRLWISGSTLRGAICFRGTRQIGHQPPPFWTRSPTIGLCSSLPVLSTKFGHHSVELYLPEFFSTLPVTRCSGRHMSK